MEIVPPVPLRVLVVDDSRDAADSLSILLSIWGHSPIAAYSADEALRVAATHDPQVALLDIGLPGMSGWDLAEALRRQAGEKPLLIVAITGYGQEADYRRSHAVGINHHLVKPLNPHELEQLLKWWQAGEEGPRDA